MWGIRKEGRAGEGKGERGKRSCSSKISQFPYFCGCCCCDVNSASNSCSQYCLNTFTLLSRNISLDGIKISAT